MESCWRWCAWGWRRVEVFFLFFGGRKEGWTQVVSSREGEGEREGIKSSMRASNFLLQPLDLVLVGFVTLILMETKSCVHFPKYTMVEASAGVFFWWTKHNFVRWIIIETIAWCSSYFSLTHGHGTHLPDSLTTLSSTQPKTSWKQHDSTAHHTQSNERQNEIESVTVTITNTIGRIDIDITNLDQETGSSPRSRSQRRDGEARGVLYLSRWWLRLPPHHPRPSPPCSASPPALHVTTKPHQKHIATETRVRFETKTLANWRALEPIERLTLNAGEVALQCCVEELRDCPIIVAIVVLWQDHGLEVEWRPQGGGPCRAWVGGGAGGGHGGLNLAGL